MVTATRVKPQRGKMFVAQEFKGLNSPVGVKCKSDKHFTPTGLGWVYILLRQSFHRYAVTNNHA